MDLTAIATHAWNGLAVSTLLALCVFAAWRDPR